MVMCHGIGRPRPRKAERPLSQERPLRRGLFYLATGLQRASYQRLEFEGPENSLGDCFPRERASHIRERMFILAHSDLQGQRQSRLHRADPGKGAGVPQRPQPGGKPGRPVECGQGVGADVGHAGGGGLDAPAPGLFPPMPGDLVEWGKVLGRAPFLKPSLQRLDDGVATWLDRSHAAGNGVVPLAAARAWRMLRAELEA